MNAPIDVTHIRIETERLILRPWEQSDLGDFFEYARVPGVGEMAGWKHHTSIAESQQILSMFIDGKKTLALELKENGKVIGSLGLEELDPDPMGQSGCGREVGYVLSKAYWGRGLIPEAVRAVAAYCFRVLDFDFLTCGHFVQNCQSRQVIEKCGFVFFGESLFETRYDTVETSRNYILKNPRHLPVDVSNITLDTQRLRLRPWRQEDLQDLFDYSSDPEVGEMAGWPPCQSMEEAQETLDSFLKESYIFALELKATGKVVGSLCIDWLEPDPEYPDPELDQARGLIVGYDLCKTCWGQGIMPEALRSVILYCFETLYADFLRCSILGQNSRSRRLAKKCGFRLWKENAFSTSYGTMDTYILHNPNK